MGLLQRNAKIFLQKPSTKPQYKVYYNEDCQKYGVQKQITDYTGTHWTQILIYKSQEVAPFHRNSQKAHCYTLYKGVAERWAKQLITEYRSK